MKIGTERKLIRREIFNKSLFIATSSAGYLKIRVLK